MQLYIKNSLFDSKIFIMSMFKNNFLSTYEELRDEQKLFKENVLCTLREG